MRSISVQNLYRVIVSCRFLFIIVGLHIFVPIYAAPIDSSLLSSKKNQDSSLTHKLSDEDSEVLADGISYRLDAWSQYDNPEEGIEREGDIHEFPESRKTSTRDQNLLWPKGVVRYWIHSSIRSEPTKFAILQEAMQDIMEKTCVTFQEIFPNENGKLPKDSWLNVTGNQKGCFADLGRSRFRPSNLNLDVTKCFRTKGHAMHEILHSLGVYHEHMRPDRDDNINILWNNIKEGDAFNFRVMSNNKVTTYGLPYDYDSIMHYSMTAFAKNKSRATIVPLKQITAIGQRDHLSFYDIKKLLITYQCTDIDPSVAKNKTENDKNPIKLIENKAIEKLTNSVTETDLEDDSYDDDAKPYDKFGSDQDPGSWSILNFFNYPKYYNSPFYANYLYYFR